MQFIEKLKRFAGRFFDKPAAAVTESAPARATQTPKRSRRIIPLEFYETVNLLPADYLICHQTSDPARVAKVKAQAEERRQRRNAKRLAQSW